VRVAEVALARALALLLVAFLEAAIVSLGSVATRDERTRGGASSADGGRSGGGGRKALESASVHGEGRRAEQDQTRCRRAPATRRVKVSG
jgi:hypothetical protein